MGEVSTTYLDVAKSAFQVRGVDVDGAVVKYYQGIDQVRTLVKLFIASTTPSL